MADDAEALIRARFEEGRLVEAATIGIETYGGEVLGFLVTRLDSESDGSEVFSIVCEDLWRGLAAFEWRCSFRTWLYVLARHAAMRWEDRPANQPARHAGLSELSGVAERVRSATAPFLRTPFGDGVDALRRELDSDERTLLILRVNRELDWNDVARVLHDEDRPLEGEELSRASARARQRFATIKRRLKERAKEVGLLGRD